MNADELRTAYEVFKQIQFDNKTDEQRHNSYFQEALRNENEHYIKFMSWTKQSYPDVWEAWRAMIDLENSAKEYIPQPNIGFR